MEKVLQISSHAKWKNWSSDILTDDDPNEVISKDNNEEEDVAAQSALNLNAPSEIVKMQRMLIGEVVGLGHVVVRNYKCKRLHLYLSVIFVENWRKQRNERPSPDFFFFLAETLCLAQR